jgi:TonB family protein
VSQDARSTKDETPSTAPDEATSSDKLGVDVAILWRGDMLTARFFARPMTVTIGPEGTFTMPEDVIGKALAVLVEPGTPAGFGLRIDHDKAHGHLIIDGDVHDLEDVRSGKISGVAGPLVALAKGTRAVLVFGDFTFIVSRVPVPPPATFSLWNKEMLPFLLCFIASLLMTAGPLIAAFNSAGFRNRTQLSLKEKQEARLAQLLEIDIIDEKPEEKPEEEEKKEEEKPKLDPEEVKKAQEEAAKREEQKVEKEAEKLKDELKDLNEEERKEKVKEIVDAEVKKVDSQLDAALADVDKQMVGTRLFAEDDGAPGDTANPEQGAGGATVLADPEGQTQGKGLMGDGGPKTSVGSSDTTKRQAVAGLEKDDKAGKDVKLGMAERKQKVIRVGGSAANASGELPKKVIQDYIRRKMGAIKACYQKGLQSNPDLQGTVKVKFLIQPSGQVGGAKIEDSSLGNASVEDCVMSNVKSWRFPQAKGGGSTTVVYPFRFSSR